MVYRENNYFITGSNSGGVLMNLFLQEHGEALIYGIVGIFLISIIFTVCTGRWKELVPSYKTDVNENNQNFKENIKDKYPTIIVDDVIYANFNDAEFDYKDYIKAKDYDGKNITSKIKYYGTVDVFTRGVYTLKCVVKSASDLVTSKTISIIVE